MPSTQSYTETAMLIRQPVTDVFNAFVDPAVTTKFWFTKSSGKLAEGQVVEWTWEMFNHTFSVTALSLRPDQHILLQWGDDPDMQVKWTFESLAVNQTFVTIHATGFKGDVDSIIAQVRDATGGFSWVLAGAKAYLEHSLELNLIADRYPKASGNEI